MKNFPLGRVGFVCLLLWSLIPDLVAQGIIQGNVNDYLKAPSVAVLEKFGNVPVGLYTGVPDINIPVYTIESRDIEVPIALNYHAGGIRVDEEATKVGLGWDLFAGGVIYRAINGKDDLIYGTGWTETYLDPDVIDFSQYAPVNYFALVNAVAVRSQTGVTSTVDLTNDLLSEASAKDFQPDVFSISLPGYSNKVVLDRRGNVIKERLDNTKIELVLTPADRFQTTWMVTTGDGYKYYFNDSERIIPHPNDGIQPEYISAWYLSRIVSPTGSIVTFRYIDDVQNLVPNQVNVFEQKDAYTFLNVINSSGPLGPCPALNVFQTLPANDYRNKRLDVIAFQNGELHFDYSARADKQGEQKLDMIRLVDLRGSVVETFKFEYDYFAENFGGYRPTMFAYNDFTTKRLKLKAFVKNPSGNEQVYKFQYNERKLPPKYSFSRDHWGFFNGALNTSLIPAYSGKIDMREFGPDVNIVVNFDGADRDPDEDYAQAFMLTKVIYPTGGHSEFQYEMHDYDRAKSNYNNDTESPEYEWATQTVNYYVSGEGNTIKKWKIVLNDKDLDNNGLAKLKIDLSALKKDDEATQEPRKAYYRITNESGFVAGERTDLSLMGHYSHVGTDAYYTMSDDYALAPGTYYIEFYLDNTIEWIRWIDLTYSYLQYPETVSDNVKTKQGGGLRVKRIVDYDNITRVSNVRQFVYNKRLHDGSYHSFGRIMSPPRYHDYNYLLGAISGGVGCIHFLLSASSNIDLFSGKGIAVAYDSVYTIYGEGTNISGKSLSVFSNQSSQVVYYNGNQRPSGIANFNSVTNGNLLSNVQYKYDPVSAAFTPVNRKDYAYEKVAERTIYGMFWRNQTPMGSDVGGLLITNFFYPQLQSCWMRLKSVKATVYDGAKELTTQTTNEYSLYADNCNARKVTTETSDNKTVITEYYFGHDFSAYQSDTKFLMSSQMNFLNAPIEVLTRVKKNDQEYVIGGSLYEYYYVPEKDKDTPAQVYPTATSKLRISAPILSRDFQTYAGANTVNRLYAYERQVTFDYSTGLVKSVIERGGKTTSFMWGYNNEFPIGVCMNASQAEFFVTGFEDTGAAGTAHTGERYNQGDYNLNFAIPNQRAYYYNYWYLLGGNWVFSGTQPYTGPVLITTGDAIDDVRVFPANSDINTFNFNPLRGITSVSDHNSKIMYYGFDAMGRLETVKNDDKDIVSRYFYHYQKLR